MKFNNTKLSIGIIYVGSIVSLTTIALYLDFASVLVANYGNNLKVAFCYFFFMLTITLPLDVFANKKINTSRDISINKIIVGNIVLYLLLISFTTIIYFLFSLENLLFVFLSSLMMQLLLLLLQEIITLSSFNTKKYSYKSSSMLIIENAPFYMTMNIIRSLKGPKILVRSHWTKQKKENYEFHLERFQLIMGSKIDLKSVLFSIVLNSIFFIAIYSYFYSANVPATIFIINLSLISNLISFIYILLLPKLSQNGITNIDYTMRSKDSSLFKENLEIFESNQDRNQSRSKIVETIFYPIPSIDTRLNCKVKKKFGLSNISRLIIFLAFTNLSIIFKGVHGNAGKPENWLLPPSE